MYLFICNFSGKKFAHVIQKEALEAWSYSNHLNIEEDYSALNTSQIIWNNRNILLGSKSVYYPTLKIKGFEFVSDLYNNNTRLSWNELLTKQLNINEIFILHGIILSLPKTLDEIDNIDVPEDLNHKYYFDYNFIHIEKLSKKYVSRTIKGDNPIKPVSEQYYEREFNFTGFWNSTYKLPFKVSVDTQTRAFQFKLLHRILYTNYDLTKRNIDVSPLCTFCNEQNETIEHVFYSCRFTETFWNEFYNCFKQALVLSQKPSLKDVIFGNTSYSMIYNHLLLIAKRHIYSTKMKKDKPYFPLFKLWVKSNYHLEYEIANKKDKLEVHCGKWITILEIINE